MRSKKMKALTGKPQNDMAMAAWLAINLLGWTFKEGRWLTEFGAEFLWKGDCKQFIYSPDGFFAVWDAVERMGLPIGYILKDLFLPKYVTGRKENRYKAFYDSVWECFPNKNS